MDELLLSENILECATVAAAAYLLPDIYQKHIFLHWLLHLTTSITADAKINPDALFGFYAEVVRLRPKLPL